MHFPDDLRYTKDHEWVRLDGNTATIGITEHAQSQLGDIVFVDVSGLNQTLNAEEIFGSVDSVKTMSDLFMPLSGTITEVNAELVNKPDLVNTDPYGQGWMIKMTVSDTSEFDTLMTSQVYEQHVS